MDPFYLFFNARGVDSTWPWPVTCRSLNHLCNSRPSAANQECISVHIGRCRAYSQSGSQTEMRILAQDLGSMGSPRASGQGMWPFHRGNATGSDKPERNGQDNTVCSSRQSCLFRNLPKDLQAHSAPAQTKRLNLLFHKASSAVSQAVTRERAARKLLSKRLRGTASHAWLPTQILIRGRRLQIVCGVSSNPHTFQGRSASQPWILWQRTLPTAM